MSILSSSIKSLVDSISGARLVIDFVTALIHDGKGFKATLYDAALADAASQELLVQVQDNQVHMSAVIAALGDFEALVFEGTTFSDAGTPLVPLNLNRASSRLSTAIFSSVPTITADGTEIFHAVLPGGQRNQALDNEVGGDGELILAANTNYLIRATNFSGAASRVTTSVTFYEPDIA